MKKAWLGDMWKLALFLFNGILFFWDCNIGTWHIALGLINMGCAVLMFFQSIKPIFFSKDESS